MTSIPGSATTAPIQPRVPAPAPDASVPLEPTEPLPTIADPGVGAGNRIGGAVLGLTIGGLIGVGAGIALRSAAVGLIGLPIGLVAGTVLGATLGANELHKSSLASARQRSEQEHGVSTLESARREVATFDHSANGSIELDNSSGLPATDERIVEETRSQSQDRLEYDFWNDEWETRTERWTERRAISSAERFEAADVAPKDRVVTTEELARLMSAFDADRNGVMSGDERTAFESAHGLVSDDWRR